MKVSANEFPINWIDSSIDKSTFRILQLLAKERVIVFCLSGLQLLCFVLFFSRLLFSGVYLKNNHLHSTIGNILWYLSCCTLFLSSSYPVNDYILILLNLSRTFFSVTLSHLYSLLIASSCNHYSLICLVYHAGSPA